MRETNSGPIMKTKAFLIGLFASVSTFAQVFTLDNFSDGEFEISGSVPFETHFGSGIIGGSRRVALYNGDGSSASVSDGVLTMIKPDMSTVFLSRYGAFNGNYGGGDENGSPLHLDATEAPFLGLTIASFASPFSVDVWLTEDVTGTTLGPLVTFNVTQAGTSYIDLRDTGLDLSDINGLELRVPGSIGEVGTFQVSELHLNSVPEPASTAFVAGLGLAGLAVARRFRAQISSKRLCSHRSR